MPDHWLLAPADAGVGFDDLLGAPLPPARQQPVPSMPLQQAPGFGAAGGAPLGSQGKALPAAPPKKLDPFADLLG